MGLLAVCDACKTKHLVKVRPCGDRVALPEGWAYKIRPEANPAHDSAEVLVSCSEPCLLQLHEAETRVAPAKTSKR